MKTYSVKQVLKKDETIEKIKNVLKSEPTYTRHALAQFLCREFNFINAAGDLQLSSCLKSLREFDAKGLIDLPQPSKVNKKKWEPRRLGHTIPVPADIPASVDQIKTIHLILVESSNRPLMRIHNELICTEHPLKSKRIVGRQLRYLIKSEHGWLGAISFSSSAFRLESRDKWIGWNNEDLEENRDFVINMSRFLIRNKIKCKNLASFVLGKCVKQLPDDYENQFGYKPLLIESFVDTKFYKGTCYKAANWILLGQTKGRGRDDTNHTVKKNIKDIYIYPLDHNFREKMGLPETKLPEIKAIAPSDGIHRKQWPTLEFGNADLGDKRLTDRLIKIAENKSLHPGASYLQAAHGDRYDIKGYYNFIRSKKKETNFDSILSPHHERTKQRMKGTSCVLVIQDTSDLNYTNLKHCEGLGFVGSNQKNSVTTFGLNLHSSYVVDTHGLPLGILNSKCYARHLDKVKKKKSEKRNTPISEKESYRWLEGYHECIEASALMPDTQIINVMDREADMYELFEEAEKNNNKVDLLIRAQHNRKLTHTDKKLFDELNQSAVRFELEVDIPPQRKRKNKKSKKLRPYLSARKAVVEVRYKKVCLKPPQSPIIKNRKEINLWAVYACEANPPEGAEKVSWFLLTTLKVLSDDLAQKCIEYYCRRWRIEEWHRVLKTGLGVEKYQNKSAERIKRILAIDMVIGWRAMFLTICGRENPGAPIELLFDATECKIISSLTEKKNNSW